MNRIVGIYLWGAITVISVFIVGFAYGYKDVMVLAILSAATAYLAEFIAETTTYLENETIDYLIYIQWIAVFLSCSFLALGLYLVTQNFYGV